MTTDFKYTDLDQANCCIRLIDLLPGAGQVKCHMRLVSIESARSKFEALSYCWGPPASLVNIFVNGSLFRITPNLHAALLRLRGKQYPRTLWVDAISINQDDKKEKSAQIPLMKDIYGSCSRVVVWLGEHDSYTESAFEGLQYMASRTQSGEKFHYAYWKEMQRGGLQNILQLALAKTRIEAISSGAAFSALFARPWFTRTWVIQEIALSPDAIVVCGKFQMPWDYIPKAQEVATTVFEGTILRFRNWPRGLAEDIFSHMVMAWRQDTTNPVDKIYAFLGLDKSDQKLLIEPNYAANVDQVFIDFTKAYVERSHNLQVLAICRGCKAVGDEFNYPSWAIDYRYDKDRDPLPHLLIGWGYKPWQAHPQGLRAGGDMLFPPTFDRNMMELQGFSFDSVTKVSMVNSTAPGVEGKASVSGGLASRISLLIFISIHLRGGLLSWQSAITFCQFYLDAKKLCEDAHPQGIYPPTAPQSTLEAFWQVLRGRAPALDNEHGARKLFEHVDRLLSRHASRGLSPASIVSITAATIVDSSVMGYFAEIGITKQRRFLITSKGYIGLGPREMRVGDEVLILRGYSAPVVARRGTVESRYRVVGDAFVHGLMDGQQVEQNRCAPLGFE